MGKNDTDKDGFVPGFLMGSFGVWEGRTHRIAAAEAVGGGPDGRAWHLKMMLTDDVWQPWPGPVVSKDISRLTSYRRAGKLFKPVPPTTLLMKGRVSPGPE